MAVGYLIYRSGFLPRALGVLMAIASVCYLTGSLGRTLLPTSSELILP